MEIDLSNATDLTDCAAAVISRAVNLERLMMARCKMITDLGIGCVAVGCRKLKLICLKWCLGVTDLGVGLIAVKCKELRSLDLSYMQVNFSCSFCKFSCYSFFKKINFVFVNSLVNSLGSLLRCRVVSVLLIEWI